MENSLLYSPSTSTAFEKYDRWQGILQQHRWVMVNALIDASNASATNVATNKTRMPLYYITYLHPR